MQGWWKKPFHKMTKNKLFACLPGLICDILGMLKDYFGKIKKCFRFFISSIPPKKNIPHEYSFASFRFPVWQPDSTDIFFRELIRICNIPLIIRYFIKNKLFVYYCSSSIIDLSHQSASPFSSVLVPKL